MARHTPRALEHRRSTRRFEVPRTQAQRPLTAKQPAAFANREQWMQMATREYFSPFTPRA